MKKIFISYRRDDATSVAHMIHEFIARRFRTENVFFDLTGIKPGDNWRDRITDALEECGVFVEIIGSQWLEPRDQKTGHRVRRLDNPHDVLRFEIETAIAKSIPIIPVLVDRAEFPGEDEVPASIRPLFKAQAHILNPEQGEYETRIEKLLVRIEEFVALAPHEEPQRSFDDRIETIADSLPTPLAKIAECAWLEPDRRTIHLNRLFMEGLRLLSLVALHDTIASGCFGSGQANPNASLHLISRDMTLNDWYTILRNSIQDKRADTVTLIAPEIQDWAENSEIAALIEDMLKPRGAWRYDDEPGRYTSMESPRVLESNILKLFGDFLFFKRYIFVSVTSPPSSMDNTFSCRILRGFDLTNKEVSLVVSDEADWNPRAQELYLLDIDERQCLSLEPALWFGLGYESDQVGGLCKLHLEEGEAHILHVEAFRSHDRLLLLDSQWQQRVGNAAVPRLPGNPPMICRPANLGKALSGWLGSDRVAEAWGIHAAGRKKVAIIEDAFDETAWQQLKAIANPPRNLDSIADKFRLENPPFRVGELVDIYRGVEKGQESISSLAFHILRPEVQDDKEVTRWFVDRYNNWRRVSHKSVNSPYAASAVDDRDTPPFIITEFVVGGRSLETRIQREGEVDRECLIRVIREAIRLCTAAHRNDVYMLTLPPRHFLIDDRGDYRITGFETAVSGDADLRAIDWDRFSKDSRRMAPEIDRGATRPTVAMDVFAIGVLLQQLRDRSPKAIPFPAPEDSAELLDVLAFHCLATDVNLRFRSMEQIERFVSEYLCDGATNVPRTVEVPAGPIRANGNDHSEATVAGFRMGAYPVTNFEYQHFWMTTGHRPPCSGDNFRLRGPWCPVIGVDFADAQAYCQWLSDRTSLRWRLPSEAEWVRAAVLDGVSDYPWGNEDPLNPAGKSEGAIADPIVAEPRANFGSRFRGPTPVGSFVSGKSAGGCYDMGGNVWEWSTNCLRDGAPFRVIKGGAYGFGKESLTVRARNRALAANRSGHLGFRVLCEGTD
ncbi:MAG: hypothetical protein AMXMBFR82_46640 [Candidatus Hydrogenedentota bacterium]